MQVRSAMALRVIKLISPARIACLNESVPRDEPDQELGREASAQKIERTEPGV